jgi:diaminohydroxyphosphoribosylaminopyrimidine deaminase / 5-amino-6-(5-phosphoribosylamino)uracil reductase
LIDDRDDWHMSRAEGLALRGVALAHPNPIVGAVIVKGNRVIGEGFHDYDRRDHAEIVALKKAGKKADGATLYVTLEPCCTTGRTGPCTKAIIAAGIRRVVAAMQDPNPAMAGKGLAKLRRAGIEVRLGVREHIARPYNEDFAMWIQKGRPLVTLKTALTLDGQISARPGSATTITGVQARRNVQKLRHESDAVLTGIGTVLADDPVLTDRTGKPRRRKLLRVVVDSRLRLPLKSKLVRSASGDVVVFTRQPSDSARARALIRAGVEVVRVLGRGGRVDLRRVIHELGKRQILNLMIEAGAKLNGAALEAGIVDKMILFYTPRIMGTGGVPMAHLPSRLFPRLPPLRDVTITPWARDFAVTGYFHDVYRHHRASRKN